MKDDVVKAREGCGTFIAVLITSIVVTAIIVFVATLFGFKQEPIIAPVFFTVMLLLYLMIRSGERFQKEEVERQEKEDERVKEEQRLELKEQIANLNIEIGWYLPKLEENEKSFYMLLDSISKEEEKLIDLERRHPKVQLMVKTRKLGDSKSKDIIKVKNLLKKLKIKKVEPISTLDSELNEE